MPARKSFEPIDRLMTQTNVRGEYPPVSRKELAENLTSWIEQLRPSLADRGRVADYIPALARADARALGICVYAGNATDEEGGRAGLSGELHVGDYAQRFSLQSIAKVFSLLQAIEDCGEATVFQKVGVEPSGDPFHSIVRLETSVEPKPANPMINAGAITVCTFIRGSSIEERSRRVLDLVRRLAGNPSIDFDDDVYRSELETAHRNRALAYFLKSRGLWEDDVEELLALYTRICSINVCCCDIARLGYVLAHDGWINGERFLPLRSARIAKRLMYMCGMYDRAGEFAVRIGLPAKSGVSGGIMAVVPHKLGIGLYSPALDEAGNSVGGTALLEKLVDEYDWAPF